jgi:hypothetical protein
MFFYHYIKTNVDLSISQMHGLKSQRRVDAICHTHLRVTYAIIECHALHLLTLIVMDDGLNPRPQKRQRTDHIVDSAGPFVSLQPSSASSQPPSTFRPLPPPVLLLALPALLALPPGHERYPLSLFLSLRALRTCLGLTTLTPDVECRAWTGLAEIGLRVINSGFTASGEHAWANGIEAEVRRSSNEYSMLIRSIPQG